MLEMQILSPFPSSTSVLETLRVGPSDLGDLSTTNPAGNFGASLNLSTPSYIMRVPYWEWGAKIYIL